MTEENNLPAGADSVVLDEKNPIIPIGATTIRHLATSFDEFRIDPKVAEQIAAIGWTSPTPVQSLCLDHSLSGRDLAGFAQTGTGKTGVFLITIGTKLLKSNLDELRKPAKPLCVVLAPTRELATQIDQDAQAFFSPIGITSLSVIGGIDYAKQAQILSGKIDIVVATPGRLKDYVNKKVVSLDNVEMFVCDEADRMFDMGFIDDVEFFLEKIPETAQKLLFSATTNDQVKELAFKYLENPEYISVNPEALTPERIDQRAVHCEAMHKLKVLLGMLKDHKPTCAIIFTNTKLTAEWLHFKIENNGIEADLITGDLPQRKRISLIKKIKDGQIKALIATDVASRGLHISCVSHVYNFDLPDEPANYIHRVGRTARAGAKGNAWSLVCEDYGQNLAAINELLGENLALKSEWFDKAYLEIKDIAGDPFSAENRKKRDPAPQRSQRDGRGPSKPHQKQGPQRGRDRGPRPETRNSRQSASSNNSQNHNKNKPKPSNNRNDNKNRENRASMNSNKPQNRSQRNNQDEVQTKLTGTFKDTKSNEPIPKSVGGIIKKLAKTLFGRK